MAIEIAPLTGSALQETLPALAALRISVFREWPYLYDGTLDYERNYLSKFASAEGTVIVAARDGSRVVGAATASPMRGHADEFAEPFLSRGYDISRLFYFGESVLLPAYRGRGIGNAFFDQREAHARSFGTFTHASFCAVVRSPDHPLRPPGYAPLDGFWQKRGFRKIDGLLGAYTWKDVDGSEETEKPMQFWLRAL